MNKVVIGVLGFVNGTIAGVLISRQYFEKKYAVISEEEINSMREMFDRKHKTVNEERKVDGLPEISDDFRHLPNVIVRSSLDPNKYEQAKKKYDLVGRMENEEVPDELVDAVTEEPLDTSKPYLIDDDQYIGECDHFAKLGLVYYLDGVLCDENEEMIDDVDSTIGAEAYRLLNIHPANMWVRNEPMGADYEIVVIHQEYGVMMDTPSDGGSRMDGPMRRRKPNEEQ